MAWIKIDRQITDHWIWNDPVKLKWWLDIIMFVNFEDKKVNIGNKLYECKRGQSMISLKSWGERWNVSKDTVRNFFYLLEKDHMIAHENCTKTTRITVCNYDTYQGDLHAKQTQSKRNPNATPTQLKKEEELKKEKEKNIDAAKAATLKRINDFKESLYPYCLKKGGKYTDDMVKDFFNYWSELNKSETKMKWELLATFQISNRLATWNKNNFNKQYDVKESDHKHTI